MNLVSQLGGTQMTIKPLIRNNIALNANPEGCRQNILNQIEELKDLELITETPLTVLIIGGSSGYGLASRIALTTKANAFTYNVSFEREPKGKSTGSAGYYNNLYFQEIAKSMGNEAIDLNADAFSHETKDKVINDFKTLNKKIDLVVYSVASGIRIDPDTQEKYQSALKPIGNEFSGYLVDIAKEKLELSTLEPATDEEITNTVKVMGGEDYLLWAKALQEADVLNQDCKFVTYTYIGSELTYPIYKDGTIGHAKRDLEKTNKEINKILSPHNGTAIISASKAVVTKASVFIPTMGLYASALFKVMKEKGTHESIVQHKYRLFKDMIYGDKAIIDEDGIYRLDHLEMDCDTQEKTKELLAHLDVENFQDSVDFNTFKNDFLTLNGFIDN